MAGVDDSGHTISDGWLNPRIHTPALRFACFLYSVIGSGKTRKRANSEQVAERSLGALKINELEEMTRVDKCC